MNHTQGTLTKSDWRKLLEALSFWIVEIHNNPENQQPPEIQREYRMLFEKIISMKNTI